MSTSSSPAILMPATRIPNDFYSIRQTRSLSELGSEAILSSDFKGEDQATTLTSGPPYFRSRPTPSSAPGSTRHILIDVPQDHGISSSETRSNNQSKGTLYFQPSADQKKKEEERHLVNLLQQYTSVKSSGSRNYNYEDKYPEDQAGEELGPNARFFNVYLDEAEKYDDDMIRGLSGTLDGLLVFAALFSVVVTTFVVDTSHALEPDQALITSSLLYEQVQYLRANGNSTTIATIQPSLFTPESLTHSTSDVWVNGLFFASLSLSLATALLSVLAKQWLQAYTSLTSGSARDTALVRHLRFMGFEKWKVPQIIGFLPLILHASLAVFIAGLTVFLRSLYPRLSWVVIGIAGPAFFVYVVSIVLPAIYIRCPYRITVLYTPMKTIVRLLQLLFGTLRSLSLDLSYFLGLPFMLLISWHRGMDFEHWWRRLCRGFLNAFHSVPKGISSAIRFIFSKVFPPTPTLKHSEMELVQNIRSCRPVLCDGIVWLHNMSSNISVRQVAACSLAGRDVDYFLECQIKKIQLSKLHVTAVSADKELWEPSKTTSSSHRAATRIAHRFQGCDLRPDDLTKDWFGAARDGRTYELAFLHHVWKLPIDSTTERGWTALHEAAYGKHYATTKLLLGFGANPNFISSEADPALSMLCRHVMDANTCDIRKLLLDAGADINLRGSKEHSWSPLYTASQYGNDCELIKWLIENGADVDKIGGPAGTALHAASKGDNLEAVKVILEHNATINLRNQNGRTALGVAIDSRRRSVEAFLRDQGATE